jgi:folate-binding protein YgfZ
MSANPAVRDTVTVSGADARSFLHSQVAQDVQSLAVGESRWTLVLAPNGRVDVLARVRCVADDRFELDTAAGFGDVLAARLDRFRIRVKAELEQDRRDVGADGLCGWWGGDDWTAGPDYEVRRVAAGWPEMGPEIVPGERIPAEIGVVAAVVSFTKGCYPGQELVERMDSRGSQAPRQLRILDVPSDAKPGDPIRDPAAPEGAPVGELTSVAGGKALGYVRRGSAVGAVPGPPNPGGPNP